MFKTIKTLLVLSLFNTAVLATIEKSENYHLTVSLKEQSVKVFQNGKLIKTMPCSTGMKPGSTPTGHFETYVRKEASVWEEPDGTKINYYYITRFNNSISFHSLIEGKHSLVEEGNKLFAARKPSSMGCVRLQKADAQWIYKLPLGITVDVTDEMSKQYS